MRLQFMGKASAPAPRDHVSTAPVAPADEDGEEEDVWAHEQIRKGMGGLLWQEEVAPADALRGARDFLAAGVEQQAVRSAGAASAVAGTGTSQAAAVAAAASEVMKTLQAGVARLQMSQQQAEKNLARTAASLQNSLAAVGQLEDELAAAGERYAYIQRLRAYVADLCNMLAVRLGVAGWA